MPSRSVCRSGAARRGRVAADLGARRVSSPTRRYSAATAASAAPSPRRHRTRRGRGAAGPTYPPADISARTPRRVSDSSSEAGTRSSFTQNANAGQGTSERASRTRALAWPAATAGPGCGGGRRSSGAASLHRRALSCRQAWIAFVTSAHATASVVGMGNGLARLIRSGGIGPRRRGIYERRAGTHLAT